MARKTGIFIDNIDDGIIVWYDGPEWDEVAQQSFDQSARAVENYARTRAPWEDRTGDARRGLTAEAYSADGQVVMTLAHTVEYGIWLETIQNGRFAIILPTLNRMAPQVMGQAVRRIRIAREGRD